ncbi:MAG: PDZ domain-containing protein [Pirellulaceae bacterium]|nr:PDZ domain-containing protein [Pirellulaceae bacterium]
MTTIRIPRNARRYGRTCIVILVCLIGIVYIPGISFAQESADQTASSAQIAAWIEQLSSDSYASRQLAYRLLRPHAKAAIPLVERSIETVGEDAAHRLIRLLAGWSAIPDEGHGKAAFAALEHIAHGGVTARSLLAQHSIDGISLVQSEKAVKYLGRLSAFIGIETNRLFAMADSGEAHFVLRIDNAFRGSIEDLDCVRWLSDIQIVRLDGPHINRGLLEKIVLIPNLRLLQIRRASITSEDLELLLSLDRLDGLEILYTPIDDTAIETIANMPLWGRLRLFGTKITADGIKKLQSQLDDSEIMFGRGGFLGIGSSLNGLEISQITSGSGAEKAGLQVGDRILTLQKVPLDNFDGLRAELAKYLPGDVVVVEYERPQLTNLPDQEPPKSKSVEVILGEQP